MLVLLVVVYRQQDEREEQSLARPNRSKKRRLKKSCKIPREKNPDVEQKVARDPRRGRVGCADSRDRGDGKFASERKEKTALRDLEHAFH